MIINNTNRVFDDINVIKESMLRESLSIDDPEKSVGYIYLTENLINHKLYIGQHRYKEKKVDKRYYGSGKLLWRAIDKYGLSNFDVYILEFIGSYDKMGGREYHWTHKYEAVENPMFYNLVDGGDVRVAEQNSFYGKHHTEETRRIISEKNKEYWKVHDVWNKGKTVPPDIREKISDTLKKYVITDLHRRHLSEALSGENNPMYGKHHTEESKKSIGLKNTGRVASVETREKQSKSISKYYETHDSPMKGKHHTDESRIKMSEGVKRAHKLDPDLRYKGKKYGEEHFNYGKPRSEEVKRKISVANTGKAAWNKGMSMSDDFKEMSKKKWRDYYSTHRPSNLVKIVCLDTGEVFDSISEAGDKYGKGSSNTINNALRNKHNYAEGHFFVRKSDYDTMTEDDIREILSYVPRKRVVNKSFG